MLTTFCVSSRGCARSGDHRPAARWVLAIVPSYAPNCCIGPPGWPRKLLAQSMPKVSLRPGRRRGASSAAERELPAPDLALVGIGHGRRLREAEARQDLGREVGLRK